MTTALNSKWVGTRIYREDFSVSSLNLVTKEEKENGYNEVLQEVQISMNLWLRNEECLQSTTVSVMKNLHR